MKRLLTVILFLPFFALAQVESLTQGEVLRHSLSVCLDKRDAIALVEAHAKDGFDAAQALWEKFDRCQPIVVSGGPKVGKVVHSVEVSQDGKKLTSKVVEILLGDEVIGYFVTTKPIAAADRPA